MTMATQPNSDVRPHLIELLNLDVQYPLQELSLRRIVINLWTEDDVLSAIQNFQCTSLPLDRMMNIWKESVETEVQRKILNVGLPSKLQKKVMTLVKPVGTDILKWKIFNEYYVYHTRQYLNLPILKQIQWTNAGGIDYGKTAEKLIHLEMLDIVERYKIACFYCLVDDISLLWEALPENVKSTFTDQDLGLITDMKLEYYWPYILRREEDYLIFKRILEDEIPLYMWAFQAFASIGNKTAAEYFYQKVPKGREEVCLLKAMRAILDNQESFITPEMTVTYPQARLSDVLCYILSMLKPKTQWYFLEQFPYGFFNCFLEWPWHDLFLRLADIIWEKFPSEEMYRPLLNTIINPGFYQYFPFLFQALFIRSPGNFKKKFIEYEIHYFRHFREFYRNDDAESIEIVLKNTEHEYKMKLITSHKFFSVFFNPPRNDRWHLAELCLIESAYSEDDKEKVKKLIEGVLVGDETTTLQDRKNALRRVFLFFFGVDEECVILKRSSSDEKQNAAKKIKKG